MLEQKKIVEIAHEAAVANLSSAAVRSVLSEPTVDSQGQEALQITIVIAPGTVKKTKGNAILKMLVAIQHQLLDAGEERFPIVRYATEEELKELESLDSGDS